MNHENFFCTKSEHRVFCHPTIDIFFNLTKRNITNCLYTHAILILKFPPHPSLNKNLKQNKPTKVIFDKQQKKKPLPTKTIKNNQQSASTGFRLNNLLK